MLHSYNDADIRDANPSPYSNVMPPMQTFCTVYWLGVLYANDAGNSPDMTAQIQEQIRESAKDLFGCMKSVETTYGNQIDALQKAHNAL